MNRLTLLQTLIDRHQYENFLEIGTHKGKTFLPLKCKFKTAVDPNFKIRIPFLVKHLYKSPANFRNRYFQLTSDKFFNTKRDYLKNKGKPDLIFIDGLHTFEASLKDVLNSFKFLQPQGTILLHDCFPPTKAAATPALSLQKASKMNIPNWKGTWCGDVWKTIVYIRKKYENELEVYVLNTDMGLGIVKPRAKILEDLTIDENLFKEINALEYDDLNTNPGIINLQSKDFYI